MIGLLLRLLFGSKSEPEKEDDDFEDFMDFVEEYEYFMEDEDEE